MILRHFVHAINRWTGPSLTLVLVGVVDRPHAAEYRLEVSAQARLQVEELLLGARHLGLLAVLAQEVGAAVGRVLHEVGAERLAHRARLGRRFLHVHQTFRYIQ